jgi:Holliday junction resolvasome RuvABC DNA-binding subunit
MLSCNVLAWAERCGSPEPLKKCCRQRWLSENVDRKTLNVSASSKNKKLTKAKAIALKIVRQRKQLADLKRIIERTGSLDENQKAQAKHHLQEIDRAKKAIEALGFDPSQATTWAKTAKKQSKRKSAAPKQKKRDGIGMYGFGSSLKVWK